MRRNIISLEVIWDYIAKYETSRRSMKSKNAFLFHRTQYEIIFCNTEIHHKNGPDTPPYYLGTCQTSVNDGTFCKNSQQPLSC